MPYGVSLERADGDSKLRPLIHANATPSDKKDVDDLVKEFVAESLDGLDRMDRCLMELESRPQDAKLLDEIFRSVHTIKGTTGFLGFSRLERLAHAGETVLGSLREGGLIASPELVGLLLQLMDGLRTILALIETTGQEGSRAADDDSELIALLGAMYAARQGPMGVRLVPEARPPAPGELHVHAHKRTSLTAPAAGLGSTEKTLRIDVAVLNRMMNLVGELVLTRNQIVQSHADAVNFPKLARKLDRVTADLRGTVMQARVQPVGQVFSKFPRMVRDLAMICGKSIRIECFGQDTGLDKSLLEAIKDPLTHAVRNAVDHGIEDARTRLLAGKSAEGKLSLRAYHLNGSVVVEVADDGGGIDTSRVLARAVEQGRVSEKQAVAMTEREIHQLVFLPGFSTATEVTHLSGRGVGMDVVRANIESVGGTVEVESNPGRGTLLRMKVPLTLAIVQALVVRCGGQSFCLPQGALAELVYVPWREAGVLLERIGRAEVYRLRETLLPIVRLAGLLGMPPCAYSGHGFYMAVLDPGGSPYGLVVDDLLTPEEIVVKPLAPLLRDIGLFSGATVLGNGELAMILDVSALASRAGIRPLPERDARAQASQQAEPRPTASFLIYEITRPGHPRERFALPLSRVERIEEIPARLIEYAAGLPLLQYRGEVMPLEDAGGLLPALLAGDASSLATILVCDHPRPGLEGRPALRTGIVVSRVVEVAEAASIDTVADAPVDGLALVNERVTVLHPDPHRLPHLQEVA
jgi:two-component system chemotaxis sensor kinase CheA